MSCRGCGVRFTIRCKRYGYRAKENGEVSFFYYCEECYLDKKKSMRQKV